MYVQSMLEMGKDKFNQLSRCSLAGRKNNMQFKKNIAEFENGH